MGEVLVSGAAGFIGHAICRALLARGDKVYGIDNLDPFYEPAVKQARMDILATLPGFDFLCIDILDRSAVQELFAKRRFDSVIHLAARAGVRNSIHNPAPYLNTNLTGFGNFIDAATHSNIRHFLFASSSSVYGDNPTLPWSEDAPLGRPRSLYAATKLAGEVLAAAYADRVPCTGLRYFTVYGPGNRPDMGMYKFAVAIHENRELKLHNNGHMERDLVYLADVVQGTLIALDHPPANGLRIRNLGTGTANSLLRVVDLLEQGLNRKAVWKPTSMLSVEAPATRADMSRFTQDYRYTPTTSLEQGIERFISWFVCKS